MTFRVAQGHAQRHVRLIGELDVAEADALIEDLLTAVEPQGDLTLDLRALDFIDSSGVRALVTIAGHLSDGSTLILSEPTPAVRRVLDLVSMNARNSMNPINPMNPSNPMNTRNSVWGRWKTERESQIRSLKLTVYTLSRSPLSVIGFCFVLVFLVIALIGPWIIPYPADITGAIHMDQKLRAPSSKHPFGTDEVGRDIYSRVIIGTRLSLQIGLIIIFIAMGIGVPLGIIAGYFGG